MRREREILQRITGRVFRAIGIRHQRPLQTQHDGHHPLLARGAQRVATRAEFIAVVESVAERVAGGSAMEAGLEAERVEGTIIGLRVGAFGAVVVGGGNGGDGAGMMSEMIP
jgi:hypothetical protein